MKSIISAVNDLQNDNSNTLHQKNPKKGILLYPAKLFTELVLKC